MTDNSPEYFEQAETIAVRVMQATLPIEKLHDVITALRAAAALAREVVELKKEQVAFDDIWAEKLVAAELRAESAESANRALQAEVDRLNRAVASKNVCLAVCGAFLPTIELIDKLREAIACTGTEPQEK